MKVGTFIHCRFIRWKETKSAVREDRESQRERERTQETSECPRVRERCEGMQRSSERFREDSGSRKGRERIQDLQDQGRECRGGERVNSAKEKGAAIITD